MNNANSGQSFRPRRNNNNYKKGGGGGRQDFRRGANSGGGHSFNTNTGGGGNQPRHPELDITIDARAAKRASMMRDKYQSMARDAQSGGDRVYGEYCLQHVEHYSRILNAYNESRPQQQQVRGNDSNDGSDDDMQNDDASSAEASAPAPAAPAAPKVRTRAPVVAAISPAAEIAPAAKDESTQAAS